MSNMPLKLAMLGDFGVGKTSLLRAMSSLSDRKGKARCRRVASRSNEFVDLELVRRNGKKVVVRVIDTAGQERYNSLTASYVRGVHGCFLVFNVKKKESFENILSWHQYMMTYADKPLAMLIGLSTRMKSRDTREVTQERALQLAEFLHTEFFETKLDDKDMIYGILGRITEQIFLSLTDASYWSKGVVSIVPSDGKLKRKSRRYGVCC